jgi:hypothetical protein
MPEESGDRESPLLELFWHLVLHLALETVAECVQELLEYIVSVLLNSEETPYPEEEALD